MDIVESSFAPGAKRFHYGCLRLWLCLGLVWFASVLSAYADPVPLPHREPFRMACSSSMFTAVNESDVRAAMKVWILTVAKDRGIPVDPDPHIYSSVEEMITYGLENAVVGFALTTPEIPRLSREMKFDRVAVGVRNGRITEEYLLLVRRDSGLERFDQLRGRSINVFNNPRMSLALIWLDTILLEARLERAADFFGQVTLNNKTAQVALPVFFGKVEACLVTRDSFEVMGELNPQLNQRLRVLAASPEVVPSGFAFRAGHASPFDTPIQEAMEQLGDSPAGRQILTLTQSDRLEFHPISCLNGSMELMARHRQLCGASHIDPAGTTPAKPLAGAR
jgi:ABC transporter, phosphonate, periplasmic substrate-binding protein